LSAYLETAGSKFGRTATHRRIWTLRTGTDNYLAHINIGRRRPIKLATHEGIRSKQNPQHG